MIPRGDEHASLAEIATDAAHGLGLLLGLLGALLTGFTDAPCGPWLLAAGFGLALVAHDRRAL